MKLGRILTAWMFAVAMLGAGAWAQDYGPSGEGAPAGGDRPQTDVARVSLIHGDVSMQRGDTSDWEATSVNAPLVRGDQVATGDRSRTEIQLDYADIVRLAARSQVKIADLTRTRIQLQVAQGYVNFTQFKGSEADVEIDTPNVAVRPLKHGRYRVQVNSDSETDVIVRDGEAEVTTPQGSTRVKEGEMIQIRGTDNPEYKIAGAPGKDDWDRWNKDRDSEIQYAHSWGRTNRYYTGVNDLDSYGHWVWVPGYGDVWQPYYTGAGWAPYQAGRWVWEPYWGWTWVSYEPWGWAPYHYGRWFYYGNSWCWWPGPVYVSYRPVWSPAFVFFVGFGHHSSFGFGSIGWFPVGPHDPFYPWWGRGFNRVNVVNVTNITNITNITNVTNVHNVVPPLATRGRQPYYSNVNLVQNNIHVRNSITNVSSEDFGRGNFANRRHGVELNEWKEGKVMTAQVPVVPSRENLRVSANANAQAGGTVQPRNVDRFYTRHQPPAGPESFHNQVERVQRVVTPDAVHASTNMGGSAQVERRDQGGATVGGNGRVENRGNAEIPRTDRGGNAVPATRGNLEVPRTNSASGNEGGKESSPGGFRRFGDRGQNNAGIGPSSGAGAGPSPKESPARMAPGANEGLSKGNSGAGPKDSPARMAPGANEGMAQNNTPSNSGNAGGSGQSNDRQGWSKFGSGRSGRDGSPQNASPEVKSNDQGHAPRTDSGTPNSTPRTEDRGGWQRFPSNSGGTRDSSSSRTDSGGGKPPLELHRPIVTPRDNTSGQTQREGPRYTPPPSRTPDTHTEQPRYTPPPSGGGSRSESPRYTPPPSGGGSRSESPRYSPPPRNEGSRGGGGSSGSGSHSGGGSSSSSRSGDRGSHSDSKSSNPKH